MSTISYRKMMFSQANAAPANRSIDVTLLTSDPIEFLGIDGKRMEYLDLRGCSIPKQIALLDGDNFDSVSRLLGSVRNIEIVGDKLVGTAYFSDRAAGREAFDDIMEGHLENLVLRYREEKVSNLPAGRSAVVWTRHVDGPARIVEQFMPLCATVSSLAMGEHAGAFISEI